MIKRSRTFVMVATVILAAVVLLAGCGGGGGGSEEAEVETTDAGFNMIEKAGMTWQWKIEGGTMEVILESPEQGWLAVGFDPQTVMKGANMIMGYVDGGEVSIADHFADKLTDHSSDEELGGTSDVTLIEGSESEEGTRLHFEMPLDSGDSEYDTVLAEGETHKVMLAYGTEDNFTQQHPSDGRAVFEVEL